MNDKQMTAAIIAGVVILAVVYIGSEQSGHAPIGIEAGAEFQVADMLDMGAMFGTSAPLDMNPVHHSWHPGNDPDPYGTPTIFDKVRYPRHCGGNITRIMTGGFNPMLFNGPDSSWAMQPPSEVEL
jgi:hypothetical protein